MKDQRPKRTPEYRADQSFGEAVRRVAIAAYGTQLGLAKAATMSASNVSHMVRGGTKPKSVTLDGLFAALDNPALQYELYVAYARELSPDFPDAHRNPDDALQTIRALAHLFPEKALEYALHCAQAVSDADILRQVLEQIVHVSSRTRNIDTAVKSVRKLVEMCTKDGHRLHLFKARLMVASVLRTIEAFPVAKIRHADAASEEVAKAIVATGGGHDHEFSVLASQLKRDQVLTTLVGNISSPASMEELQDAVRKIELAMRITPDPGYFLHHHEVKARVQLAMNRTHPAEETLEQMAKLGVPEGSDLEEKAWLVQASISRLRGDRDEAIAALTQAIDLCSNKSNVHHLQRAKREMALILA